MSILTKKAYLIDTGYTVREGKTYVSLLLKGKNKSVKLYYRYDPYFFVDVPADKANGLLEITVQRKFGGIAKPLRVEMVELKVGLVMKKFAKLYCQEPSDVPIMKSAIPFACFEYNIPFSRRFIFDMQLVPFSLVKYEREDKKREIKKILSVTPADPQLNVMAFDIETYNPLGMPNENKDPSIMISYCSPKRKGVITFKKTKHDYVEVLKDEKEMLERFSKIVLQDDPDVLSGYNSSNFDLPYLKTRAEKTKASFRLGRFGKQYKEFRVLNKGNVKGMRLEGRVHFDLFPLVKFFSFIGIIKAQNMSLDSVAEDVLHKKKVKMPKDNIWKSWDSNDIDLLCEYSLVDSELALELTDRFLVIEVELSKVAKLPLFDTSISTSGQLVENLLMYNATHNSILIPSKPGGEAISERLDAPIQGAFVKLPEPGIYENIAVLDFRGLYPSIIISYNIDPDTLVEANERADDQCHLSPTGAKFSKKDFGLIPSVLNYLVEMRGKIKDDLKKQDKDSEAYIRLSARSQSLKILANSIAGDEPLLLQDPNGRIRTISASDFIDGNLSSEFIEGTQLGTVSGWKAASFKDNKISFRNIKKIMRHKSRKLLKITLKSGKEIKVTEDHSLFTLNSDGIVIPISAKDLTKKSSVVVPKKITALPSVVQSNTINLIRELAAAPAEDTGDIMLNIRLGQDIKNLPAQNQILSELEEIECGFPSKIGSNIGMQYASVSNQIHKLVESGFVLSKGKLYPPFLFSISETGKRYHKFLELILPHLKYNENNRMHFLMFNDIRSKLGDIEDEFLSKFFIGPINGTKIPSTLTVDSNIARLLGYFVSEGHSRKWKNQTGGISYRSAVTNFDQEILHDMETCFNALGVSVQKTKTTIQSNTKMSYLIFRYVFKCGGYAHEKLVPEFILNSTNDLKSEFLYAYYLGDGTYATKQKMYKFNTKSRDLANGLSLLLLQLGIGDFNLIKDNGLHRIRIWEELPFFGKTRIIGKKFDQNMTKGKKIRNRHFNHSIPGSLITNEISQLKNISYYYAKSKRISKEKLLAFYGLYSKKFGKSKKIQNLISILEGDLSLDEVKSVEMIEKPEYVYDLSVEETENFIGGFGWTCLHNSFYGYTGYARSRWYSRPCAESVTAWGRKHIMDTISIAENAGFQVLYSDTDSVFLIYKDKKDVLNFMENVNKSLPEKMELELEGFYTRGVFVSKRTGGDNEDGEGTGAKKKYALLGEDGRTKIRGFELVRRDWSSIAKETQLKVLEAILKDGSKEKAAKIIRDTLTQLREGKVPLEKLAISTQITKDPSDYDIVSPETTAAKKMIKAGIRVEKGSIIAYVIGRSGKTISEKAEPLELATSYDTDYYVNNQVLPAVMKIMKELGYDEYSMKVGGKQKGLGDFF